MNRFHAGSAIVPIDFSVQSFSAVDTALEIVARPAHVTALHILPVLNPTEFGGTWEEARDSVRQTNMENALRDEFSKDKYKDLQFAVSFGDPGSEIAKYAEEHDAELVVIPSHGRTGMKHLLMGSVAERVCRLAHCPVLVLKS
jgi:nucleotide-binding universal stress UspA family protein